MIGIVLSLYLFSFQLFAAGFVQVKHQRLFQDGSPYVYIGANYWQAMNLATYKKAQLLLELDQLQQMGVRNLRILALSEGAHPDPYRVLPAVMTSPDHMNEDLLKGLDFVLVEMKKRQMTAVICLANFWPWSGGFAQWVSWTQKNSIPYPPPHPGGNWSVFQEYAARFYTLPEAVQAQKRAMEKIIKRVNSYSHVAYTNDSTIMAWELANEPRGDRYRPAFLKWINSTAKWIKSIDQNHLVTTGSEGDTLNADSAGNNFLADHQSPFIDYTTIHIWVENWGIYRPMQALSTMPQAMRLMQTYLKEHQEKSNQLKKPMVLEEFGMARDFRSMDPLSSTNDRDYFYAGVFKQVADNLDKINGINFWAWSGKGRPAFPYGGLWRPEDDLLGDPPHEEQGWYGVYDTDFSTINLISNYARQFSHHKGDGKNILVVTDSHGEGAFGAEFIRLLEFAGHRVSFYAVGGSIPADWLTGKEQIWGYFEHHTGQKDIRSMKPKTPLLATLIQTIRPDWVILAQGTNLIWRPLHQQDYLDVKKLVELVQKNSGRCIWISQPALRPDKLDQVKRELEIRTLLKNEVEERGCDLIPSYTFTHYPESGGDGIHYDQIPLQGESLAKSWAWEVMNRLK